MAGLLLGLLLAPAWAAAADWPAFKGDAARSGLAPALEPPVHEAWRVHLKGSLYSSPAVSQGRVLLGSSAKRLYCLDLKDGAMLWAADLPDHVWGSSPAVADGQAFVGCVDGCVHALALADGHEVRRWCGQPHGFFGGGDEVYSAPLVAAGKLVFGSDDQAIYGVDLQGAAAWRVETDGIIHDNGACACGSTAYIPSRDGKLYALALADGAQRWAFSAPKPFNTVPLCDGGTVWAGDGDSRLYCLDAATGAVRWSFLAGKRGLMSSPALGADGTLVFGSTDGSVYGLDGATGQQRWRHKTGDMVLASPLITGAVAWIGSFDGSFRALRLADGHELWRSHLDGGIFTSAAASGDRVLVSGRDGDLACFQATPPPAADAAIPPAPMP